MVSLSFFFEGEMGALVWWRCAPFDARGVQGGEVPIGWVRCVTQHTMALSGCSS